MRRRAEMSGIFDWLKKLVPPSIPKKQPSTLPVLRQEQLPAAPIEEKKSVIEFFRPKPKGLIEAPKGVYQVFAAPEKVRLPEAEEKPEVKWQEIIPQAEEAGVPIAEELTRFLKPSTVFEASRYVHPSEWPFGEPPVWSSTPWQMPTTYEVAEYIRQRWDLKGIYERVLNQIETPWWQRQVFESAHEGKPAVLDVDLLSYAKDPSSDISRFLRIPDVVIELYARLGREGINRFNVEVLQPMLDRVEKALEVFRPAPVLRGWFEIEPDEDLNFWLRYKEARFPQQG